ncbi:MAG: CBS domain-containing protein, partial [Thermodesulfovibrionales bacterium]
QGLHGHSNLVPWIWSAMAFNVTGFLIFLIPKTRKKLLTLNIGCVLIFVGIWIEKGMGMVIPGFVPDTLGEIYEYTPSIYEILITTGIFSGGAMLYTLLVRAAIAVETGRLRHPAAGEIPVEEEEGILARDIMTENVLTASPETPIEEIARALIKNRISGMPVVDKENRVLGVVSESDIIYREIHREPHLLERLGEIILPEERRKEKAGEKVSDIMTSPAITAFEDARLNELVQIITEKKIKRIVIVDREGRLKGIVSRIDIVRAMEKVEKESLLL